MFPGILAKFHRRYGLFSFRTPFSAIGTILFFGTIINSYEGELNDQMMKGSLMYLLTFMTGTALGMMAGYIAG